MAAAVQDLGFKAARFLRLLAQDTGRTSFLLSLTLGVIQAASLSLDRFLNVFVLRLKSKERYKDIRVINMYY